MDRRLDRHLDADPRAIHRLTEWPVCRAIRLGRVAYRQAERLQRDLVARRRRGEIDDVLLLLEHPPVITIGRGGDGRHLLAPPEALAQRGIEIVNCGRGGDITYHGPGQAVGYLVLDLTRLYLDLQRLFAQIEAAIMDALAGFGIHAVTDPQLTGVWVGRDKIAAIGLRVRRWVTMHGFALNVANDLAPFADIVPCGIGDRGVTSMARLGCRVSMDAVFNALAAALAARFDRRPSSVSLSDLLARAARAADPRATQRCEQPPSRATL